VFKGLGYQKSVERWLVVPNLRVERVSVKAERGLSEFKTFVGADFYGGSQWHQSLEEEKHAHEDAHGDVGVPAAAKCQTTRGALAATARRRLDADSVHISFFRRRSSAGDGLYGMILTYLPSPGRRLFSRMYDFALRGKGCRLEESLSFHS
jgi:hypothetical protein